MGGTEYPDRGAFGFDQWNEHQRICYGDGRFELSGRHAAEGRSSAEGVGVRELQAHYFYRGGLIVTAPTGKYDENKLLNLGTARWSFKPEIGVCQPFGRAQRCEIDGYASLYFFTDNTTYRGVEILKQRPLPGIEAHLSYSFNNAIWASVDTRYSFR